MRRAGGWGCAPAPAEGPTVELRSDSVCLERAPDPTGGRLRPTRLFPHPHPCDSCHMTWPTVCRSEAPGSPSFSSVQFSHSVNVRLFATPWTAACWVPLSSTVSRSLLKLMSIELVMLSNHLILCRPPPFYWFSNVSSKFKLFLKYCVRQTKHIRRLCWAHMLPVCQ